MSSELKRNNSIDYLRAIALICIVIAHSGPDALLGQLRNFDVVLMVLLMGMSFSLSTEGDKTFQYFGYVVKRFKRLILTTWKFLVAFFILFYILSLFIEGFFFPRNQVIGSFTTFIGVNSIGYVWIMRVFFLIAIINPFLYKLSKSLKSDFYFLISVIVLYIIYHFLILKFQISNHYGYLLYDNIIIYTFGYGIVAYIGMRLLKLTPLKLYLSGGLFFLTYLIIAFSNSFVPTQEFKYPPSLYYFSYGLFASIFLYILLSNFRTKDNIAHVFMKFVSNNSITIYFWHIIFIYFIKKSGYEVQEVSPFLVVRFLILLVPSLALTKIQLSFYSSEKVSQILKI